MCLHHCWATHPPFTSHFRGGFTKLGFPQENTRHFARRAFFHLCGKVLNLIFATFPCQRRARLMLLLVLSDISGEEYLDFYIILLTCVLKSLLLPGMKISSNGKTTHTSSISKSEPEFQNLHFGENVSPIFQNKIQQHNLGT